MDSAVVRKVALFGNLQIYAYFQLPEAFCRLLRPSLSLGAEVSTVSLSSFEPRPSLLRLCHPKLTTFIIACSPKSNSSQNLTQKVLSWDPILTKDSCGSGGSNYRRTRNEGLSPLSAQLFSLKNAGFKNESLPFSDPDCPT
ncbi:hypothetical protein HAX54_002233 [Datura stramonium]|uniref:Uncharacterized protein n=1 Tax=Datura stramonium TaxID=4076 RepID=A0ABS8T5P9_DATST|nr:hypothetical protein [Datura stramonium]